MPAKVYLSLSLSLSGILFLCVSLSLSFRRKNWFARFNIQEATNSHPGSYMQQK